MILCIDKQECVPYMESVHIVVGNMHLSPKQTLRRIKCMGVYWTTMNKDVHKYIRECTCWQGENPIVLNCITLYKMSPIAPKWAKAMVEYMTTNFMPKKMSKVRQRYLQKHAQDYCIIAKQLYYCNKDGSLRICVIEVKYLKVVFHTHSCLPRGHFLAKAIAKAIMRASLWWPTFF